MTVLIKWKESNAFEEGHRIYRNTQYFSSKNLPNALVELGANIEEYEDTTANPGENWYIISSFMINGHEVFSQAFIPEGKS